MSELSRIAEQLVAGASDQIPGLIRQALAQGRSAGQILAEGLIAGMSRVSQRYSDQEIFLPEVLLAARAMNAGLEALKSHLMSEKVAPRGRIVLGTVQGDVHDIGKNLVGIMLRGAGFEVIDLGHDVAPERFVAAAQATQASVIAMSALLTTTMPAMARTIEVLHAQRLGPRVRTIIGGAPVTLDYARRIGADAYGFDAVSAVEQVQRLVAAKT